MSYFEKFLNAKKISFDYDGTFSKNKGFELAKKLIEEGNSVYIISARSSVDGILKRAKDCGILPSRIYATGSNDEKIKKVIYLGINTHYDNNIDVVKSLPGIGKLI
jgi:short-subunit dehydrogenase involved in D-alanine esterification of teichoic acids